MEPNQPPQRLGDMNAPAIRAFGEPEAAAAHDISAQSRAHTKATEFDEFYRRQADPIGRALDITLNDPELAEDALNEPWSERYSDGSVFHDSITRQDGFTESP